MTKSEARKALQGIEDASEEDLKRALGHAESRRKSKRNIGAAVGGGLGVALGAILGNSNLSKILGAGIGGALGAGAGAVAGGVSGSKERKRIYEELKRRKGTEIAEILRELDDDASRQIQDRQFLTNQGIQTNDTPYGVFAGGKGTYSEDDRVPLKKDKDGNKTLSLLFAGINSSVEDGKSSAHSPLAERFYNKNRSKFSDVQANSIFDDPIVADAYVDKIMNQITANRIRTGKYPKMRIVGYSAGGRGIVNFLKKMRERDPKFKVDEIVGIDPYQFLWEGIPDSLGNPANPVANKIVYSRLADNYTGSKQKGLGRLADTLCNTFVSLGGKKLKGLAANTVVEDLIPGISHTDADEMYDSALRILAGGDKK